MVPSLVNDLLCQLSEPVVNSRVDKIRTGLLKSTKERLGHILTKDNLAIRCALIDPKYTKLEFVEKEVKDHAWKGIVDDNRPVLKEESIYPQTADFFENEVKKLRTFFESCDLSHVKDSLLWWKGWQEGKRLHNLARRYLCVPATSTPSERCFSDAGFIYNKKRASLDEDTVERLVFIRENFHFVPKNLSKLLKDYVEKKKKEAEEHATEKKAQEEEEIEIEDE